MSVALVELIWSHVLIPLFTMVSATNAPRRMRSLGKLCMRDVFKSSTDKSFVGALLCDGGWFGAGVMGKALFININAVFLLAFNSAFAAALVAPANQLALDSVSLAFMKRLRQRALTVSDHVMDPSLICAVISTLLPLVFPVSTFRACCKCKYLAIANMPSRSAWDMVKNLKSAGCGHL